jgi:hypothetical protein
MDTTADRICEWIAAARRNLELTLLDFGGKHSPDNHRMLRLCSHSIVLARRLPDAAEEAENGIESWRRVCAAANLSPLAVLESVASDGVASVRESDQGWIEGQFHGRNDTLGDQSNRPLIDKLTERLLTMRVSRPQPGGVDLRLSRDWSPSDISTLAGLAADVEVMANAGAPIELSGIAPIWAYLVAMHRALAIRPTAEVRIWDPKVEGGWVAIPQLGHPARSAFPAGVLTAEWEASPRPGFCALKLAALAEDRMLPPAACRQLDGAPLPTPATPPCAKVVVTGPGPIWLHAAYSRWLRTAPGVTTIAVWDGRNKTEIVVGP